eukprot:CAMPEP_0113954766 /NCGR_PEP_ID=MMETSP0011_2-20120614/820_1 /TAXON_ID=101924 /ORGANISM="Rhodosorus marinus" /LENGTH=488 /DNA_ID=CAMNT_0000964101 /DNA_START=295 /DNA_END=1761 /DNA_ORIENTATION=- /assembly_acc=CAM_ASM_000156
MANLQRAYQSFASFAGSMQKGIAAVSKDGIETALQASSVVFREQEAMLSDTYVSAEGLARTSILSPIEEELLRARDAIFRMDTRRRMIQEIETLRPQAQALPQVQQYLQDKRTEYDATTKGLIDTLSSSIPRQRNLFPGLVAALVDLQAAVFNGSLSHIQNAKDAIGPDTFDELKSQPISLADGDLETHATEAAKVAQDGTELNSLGDDFDLGGLQGALPGDPPELNEELRRREELRKESERELKERADSKLAEVKERQDAESREQEEVSEAKKLMEQKILTWTHNDQFRGSLIPLLTGLEKVIPEDWNWKGVSKEALQNPSKVKLHYNKAILVVHPDKLLGRDPESKALGELIFDELQNAWKVFTALQEGQQPPPGSVGPKQPNFGEHAQSSSMGMSAQAMNYANAGYMGSMGQMNSMGYNMGFGSMGYGVGAGGMNAMNVPQYNNMGYGMGMGGYQQMNNQMNRGSMNNMGQHQLGNQGAGWGNRQ